MNIVLRILVILTLAVNAIAFVLAKANYEKRNLLIDRNIQFRDFTVQIAKTFEAEEPVIENTAANHTARDISPVTLASADITPDTSDYWESYKEGYEKIDNKSYQIANPSDLDEVYILNAEGKPEKDFQGNPVKDGAPMANTLADVLKKAMDQRARMNNIRAQLTNIREEYEETITDLNEVKKQGRESLKTIAAKEEQIADLESKKVELEGQITELKDQVQTLENDKVAMQEDLDKYTEENETLKGEVEKLKTTLERIAQGTGSAGGGAAGVSVANIVAGDKGKVVRVDNNYNYCIVKLDPAAMTELIGEDGSNKLPEIDYLVRREGGQELLGKIRLRTVAQDAGVVVCEILVDWKQGDIKTGDIIFYLN
jgi:uncharacterized phage infection (PIP) family protein YhgE